MGWYAYWNYHFEDESLEKAIAEDSEESIALPYLYDYHDLSQSDLCRVDDPETAEFIVDKIANVMVGRCWRFSNLYADCQQEEYFDTTLIVRKHMIEAQEKLPQDFIDEVETYILAHIDDKFEVMNWLYALELSDYGIPDTFNNGVAWHIYRSTIFELYDARTLVVEDVLSDEYWQDVRKRVVSAAKVKVEQVDERHYIAKGSSKKYNIDTFKMTCDCRDFQHRGKKYGIHCKHLVAALQAQGSWHENWGQYIP